MSQEKFEQYVAEAQLELDEKLASDEWLACRQAYDAAVARRAPAVEIATLRMAIDATEGRWNEARRRRFVPAPSGHKAERRPGLLARLFGRGSK